MSAWAPLSLCALNGSRNTRFMRRLMRFRSYGVAVNRARRENRPVLAVGTTVVRALEDAAEKNSGGARESCRAQARRAYFFILVSRFAWWISWSPIFTCHDQACWRWWRPSRAEKMCYARIGTL